MIKVDHAQMGIEPVEAGFATLKVSSLKKQKAKSSDNQVVLVTSIVTKHDNKEQKGRRVVDNLTLLEQSLWNIDAFYFACTGEHIPEGDFSEQDLFEMLESTKGMEFSAEITIDQAPTGRMMNKLSNYAG